jgi:RHS repeat-associated protein
MPLRGVLPCALSPAARFITIKWGLPGRRRVEPGGSVQAGQTSLCGVYPERSRRNADFYPFGGERDITTTCGSNYKFEGKERDTETGNDDFGARYYTSRLGRWLSADWSSVPAPVPYANLTNPQTLNLYAMVRDNPETFADLDGHVSEGQGPYNLETGDSSSGSDAQGHRCDYVGGDCSKQATQGAAQQQAAQTKPAQPAQQQNQDQGTNPQCAKSGCGTGTPQNSGLKPPPPGKPPIPLPPGANGKPNEWVQVPGTQDKKYGPKWQPKHPPKGGQPSAQWDPVDGYWTHHPGDGSRTQHFDKWGNRINMKVVGAAGTVGAGAIIIRVLVTAGELGAAFP